MRICKWKVTAFLVIALTAMAQEPAGQLPSLPTPSAQSVTTPAPQPTTPMPAGPARAAGGIVAGAPTTMDQVVDRAIVREHALMEALKTRTPLMETYLQN